MPFTSLVDMVRKPNGFTMPRFTPNIVTLPNQTAPKVEPQSSGVVFGSGSYSGSFRSITNPKGKAISDPKTRAAVIDNVERLKPSGVVAPNVGLRFNNFLDDVIQARNEFVPTTVKEKTKAVINVKRDRDVLNTKPLGKTIKETIAERGKKPALVDIDTSEAKAIIVRKENPTGGGSQPTLDRPTDTFSVGGGVAQAEAKAVPAGKPFVFFPPFCVPIFVRDKLETLSLNESAGGIKDKTIPVGTYVMTFELPQVGFLPQFAIATALPFTCSGKQMRLDKMLVDPVGKIARMQITVVENPIPLIALIIAGAGAVGFAGWGLEKSLKQVDKVILSTGQLVLIGVVGLVAWYAVPRFIGGKKAA